MSLPQVIGRQAKRHCVRSTFADSVRHRRALGAHRKGLCLGHFAIPGLPLTDLWRPDRRLGRAERAGNRQAGKVLGIELPELLVFVCLFLGKTTDMNLCELS